MIDVQIVPVERLTSHGQLFRCEPLHATMPVRACLARRSAKTQPRFGEKKPLHPTCAACPLGAEVAARVEGRPDSGAPAGRVCVEPGCSAVVTGGHPRMKPRCPDHRPHRSPASTTPTPPKETAAMPTTSSPSSSSSCERCHKHPTSPVVAKTPKGTETWCKHCRRVASMQAHGKGFFGRKPAPPSDAAPAAAPAPAPAAPALRLIVPPEAVETAQRIGRAVVPAQQGAPTTLRVTVVSIECDASQVGAISALVAGLR